MVEEYSKLSDEELVEKTKAKDTKAFAVLVHRYEQKVYNLAYRIVNDTATAKDILQETFTKVYRSLKTFKSKSKFSTWLYRIALNFCLMHKRKKHVTVSLDNPISTDENEIKRELPDWSDNPEATVQNREFKKKLDDALALLPNEYKSVVVLRDIQGLPNKEVSKILNISIPAVKSRIHRARIFLRDKLSEYFRQNYGQL